MDEQADKNVLQNELQEIKSQDRNIKLQIKPSFSKTSGKSIKSNESFNGSKIDTLVNQNNIFNIFENDKLLDGCYPIFLSKSTQTIFNILADKQITKESPTILIQKSEILKDLQMRAAISDFSVMKEAINQYPSTDILLLYDAELTFGENFILVLSDKAKDTILNLNRETITPEKEEEYEDIVGIRESVIALIPNQRTPWMSLGSHTEILESMVVETRPKIVIIFEKSRRDFSSLSVLTDEKSTQDQRNHHIAQHEERQQNIPILELDKALSNAELKFDKETNTEWKYPRNAFTQHVYRNITMRELHSYYNSEESLIQIKNAYPLIVENITQNIMYNFLDIDYENLAFGDKTYDTKANNTFKEYLSFSDLKYSKNKAITNVQWHPTIKGIVAVSVGERLNYDQRIDESSRILMTPTYILIWSFSDPIQPQLLLEAPEDVLCFQFNPTNPNIIAGGCINGQVVLWDIEKYMNDLSNVKVKMKSKTVAPIFAFDDTETNKVPISPHCAVSNIEASHISPIMDLQWIPCHFEINRLGHCLKHEEAKCVQLITCGLNSEVLVWDIRPDKSPLAIDMTQDSIQTPIDVPKTFAAINVKWKPLLRVHLYKTDPGGDHAPTKFSIKESHQALSTDAYHQTAINKSESDKDNSFLNADTHFYVGTEDGDLVYVDWIPQKDQDTGKMQTPKPDFYSSKHDGPISYLGRSPFESSILLVVGGRIWSLWKEGAYSDPLLESVISTKPYTNASWSPSRPSVFYICRADGLLEVWDLLDKSHEPVMVQTISANGLTSISLCNVSREQIIAIGDVQGVLQLFTVPHRLTLTMPTELSNFKAYIDHELKRKAFVSMRWHLREKEKLEQQLSNKQKMDLSLLVKLTEDELIHKEKIEYEQYLSDEHVFLQSLGLITSE